MAAVAVRDLMLRDRRRAAVAGLTLSLALLVTAARAPAQNNSIRFTTDEGTWISLDVDPAGDAIVFELLGDLYTIPASPAAKLELW